jgi:hypothetical protein
MKILTESQQSDSNDYLKILLYGQSGSGKTTFACNFPNAVLFDFERGRGKNKVALQLIPDKWQEIEEFINRLENDERFINSYETVIFDSLNEMIDFITEDVVLGYDAKRQYGDQLTLTDYGKINREIMKFIRSTIKRLGDKYHLIFICAENPITYQDEQRQPSLLGKVLPVSVPRLMDIVGCTFLQKETHYLSIASTSFAYAKNRYGISGNKGILKPNYSSLIELISD